MSQYPYQMSIYKVTTGAKNTNIKKEVWTRKSRSELSRETSYDIYYLSFHEDRQEIGSYGDKYFVNIEKAIEYFTQQLKLAESDSSKSKETTKRHVKAQRDIKRFTIALDTLKAYKE